MACYVREVIDVTDKRINRQAQTNVTSTSEFVLCFWHHQQTLNNTDLRTSYAIVQPAHLSAHQSPTHLSIMANQHYADEFYDKAARAEVSSTIISKKANVCPFTVRLAWHASGTFDKVDASPATAGGSDGASMRFTPEVSDGANAGLALMQDIIKPVKAKFPNMSYADLWTMAGTQAIALTGGPKVPFNYGRVDAPCEKSCPPNGRLPDATQGAQHLRDVFYRMGFGDKEIVALSGAHTLGSCHRLRSGFDGPWTHNPLQFDNEYFKNLLDLEWTEREWDGPKQFQDQSGELMMLPT